MRSTLSVVRRAVARPVTAAPITTSASLSSSSSYHTRMMTTRCNTSSSCACASCLSQLRTRAANNRRTNSNSNTNSNGHRRHGAVGVFGVAMTATILTLTSITLADSKQSDTKSSSAAANGMSPEEARIVQFQALIDGERRRLEKEAATGDAKSQLALGVLLLRDIGELEGVKWIRMAAAQQLADARHAMAILQLDGIGTPTDQQPGGNGVIKDQSAALLTLRTLAASNHADSQLALAMAFDQGLGVTRDQAASADWLTKSAENGNPRAQYLAATTILQANTNGEESAAMTRALKWMHAAATANDPMAQAALGSILLQGDDESIKVAVEWLRRADAQGSITAHYLLGQCVEKGQGGLRADAVTGARMKKEAVQAGYMAK